MIVFVWKFMNVKALGSITFLSVYNIYVLSKKRYEHNKTNKPLFLRFDPFTVIWMLSNFSFPLVLLQMLFCLFDSIAVTWFFLLSSLAVSSVVLICSPSLSHAFDITFFLWLHLNSLSSRFRLVPPFWLFAHVQFSEKHPLFPDKMHNSILFLFWNISSTLQLVFLLQSVAAVFTKLSN